MAISFEKLGEITQCQGNLGQSLQYYNEYNKLMKELYTSNPQNINLLENLGISYYKLTIIYKAMWNDQVGRANFAEWKKIILFLAEKFPQVSKYEQWKRVEY